MKIAINCAFLQPKGGGVKEYMVNLVNNLSRLEPNNDYVIYVLRDFEDYAKQRLMSERIRIKLIPFKTGSNINKIKRSLFEHKFWIEEEKKEKWDLFHSPFFHAPKLKKTKIILTVHDLRFVRYPETYSRLRATFLKHAVKRSILNAAHIISISEFTKSEIKSAYGIDDKKITTIHEAINPTDFTSAKASAVGPTQLKGFKYILSVGHLEPRKNYDRLINAFKIIKNRNVTLADYKLVIVGKKECYYDSTLKAIESSNDIEYLNFVSHETLIWLYRNADLFIFPSLYEGFGFPPLEAAALGVISAVSEISSIPEICGDSVIYFNPYDIEDMALNIEKALVNKEVRNHLNKTLPDLVNKFSWEKNAMDTLKLYHSLT